MDYNYRMRSYLQNNQLLKQKRGAINSSLFGHKSTLNYTFFGDVVPRGIEPPSKV